MPPPDFTRRALMCDVALAAVATWASRVSAFAGVVELDELAHELLLKMPSSILQTFLRDWPAATIRRTSTPAPLPVLRYLPTLRANTAPFSEPLTAALIELAPALAWRRSYSRPAVSAQFLDNYGWSEFIGLTGPLPSARLACGVLLLGPDTMYPAHHHEAEEIYIPLSGIAAWKQGSGDWEDKSPGTVIHHMPQESHAMRTARSPLLALYLWRSDNLAQKSQLD